MTLVVTYDTQAGQRFVVTQQRMKALTTVEGKGLRVMRHQRGTTERLADKPEGSSLVSAHLVANLFGGSGHLVGENVVSTSQYFNNVVMGDQERAIVTVLSTYADGHRRRVEEVSFDLTVQVSVGDLDDKTVLAMIRNDPELRKAFKPGKGTKDLEHQIIAKLTTARKDKPLRRVTEVAYSLVRATLPARPGKQAPRPLSGPIELVTGPDIWLLLKD